MIRTLVCGLALLLTCSSLLADELRTLGGKTVTGSITAISDKAIILKTETGLVDLPLSQVLDVDLRGVKGIPLGTKYTDVRLLDDSILHCQSVDFKGNDAELTLTSEATARVPINFLVWMVQEAQNPSLRKKFDDLLGQKSKRDRIVVLRGTELNALEGTLGDIDAKGITIQFRRDGADAIGQPLDRLHGLIF
jgi:hypothetical protein